MCANCIVVQVGQHLPRHLLTHSDSLRVIPALVAFSISFVANWRSRAVVDHFLYLIVSSPMRSAKKSDKFRCSIGERWLALWVQAFQLCFTWWVALFMYWTALLVFSLAAFGALCSVNLAGSSVERRSWDPQRRVKTHLRRLFVRERNKGWKQHVKKLRRDGRWKPQNFDRERSVFERKRYQEIHDPYFHQRRADFVVAVVARVFGLVFLICALLSIFICMVVGLMLFRIVLWKTIIEIALRLAVVFSEADDSNVVPSGDGSPGCIYKSLLIYKHFSEFLEQQQCF